MTSDRTTPDDGEATRTPTAEQLAEHVSDLHALTAGLAAQLADHENRWAELAEITAQLESGQHTRLDEPADQGRQPAPGSGQIPLFSVPATQPAPRRDGEPTGHPDITAPDQAADDPASSTDEEALAPRFIVLFDPGSNEEHAEILALDDWVREVLVPTYITQVSSRQPWCDHWWDHPEALARIHALWLSWQEMTDQTAGGHTGPSRWHRDLDDAMAKLRSHDGPFSACMIDPQAPSHRRNRQTPVTPYEDSSPGSSGQPA